MHDDLCCVCHKQQAVRTIGGRPFCEEHYQHATHARPLAWRSMLVQVGAMLAFAAIVFVGAEVIQPVFSRTSLLATGVLLALVPSIIWLSFFYQQDRLEPEPKGYVLGVFALGALLAFVAGVPLVTRFFRVGNWLYADALTTILGSILVVGFVQEFIKYAAVRYSVYNSPEYDEPTDGIIYASAAGLGYATVLNVLFVVESGGVALGPAGIRIVVTALAHASFAGITGYFLGRAKFMREPIWWMPLGITLAATANGLFFWLRGALVQGNVSVAGSGSNPWLGLVLAAVLAGGVAVAVAWLIRRNIRTTLAAG
jgi:protease PrsW